MKAECEKFGEVRKVIVFDVSIDSISCTFFFYIQERLPIGMVMKKINVHRNLSFTPPLFAKYQLLNTPQELESSVQNLMFKTTILIVMAPNIFLDFPHNSSEEWSYFPP